MKAKSWSEEEEIGYHKIKCSNTNQTGLIFAN